MKKLIPLLVVVFVFGVAFTASAKPVPGALGGTLVANITLKVQNSMDSGVGGNYWAFDNYNRLIKIYQTGDSTFTAVVQDVGKFTTVQGTSPAGTSTVAGGITGALKGGYTMTITGTFDPQYATFGNIGKFDYQCDPGAGTCSNAFNWLNAYFDTGYTYSYDSWGWTYHTGRYGSWTNSSGGNSGDIE